MGCGMGETFFKGYEWGEVCVMDKMWASVRFRASVGSNNSISGVLCKNRHR